MRIQRTVQVSRDAAQVYDYLADFTTTTEWDAGTVQTTLLTGDGGVGTRYRNHSKFLGRSTELIYEVMAKRAPVSIELRGENKTVVAYDVIEVHPRAAGGAVVSYQATFTFKGWARLVSPLLAPAFRKLGNDSAAQLARVLNA